MASSIKVISGNTSNNISQARLLSSTQSVEARSNSVKSIKEGFSSSEEKNYGIQRDNLLNQLNAVLSLVKSGASYSFDANGNLPIDTIFNECKLSNINCNEGKKAYAYYLKEVLQKLNQLNQGVIKGQTALTALNKSTTEDQIKSYETTLEIQSDLVKNCLNELTKYTVIQTLDTIRESKRKNLSGKVTTTKSEQTSETNYKIEHKDISTSFSSIVPDSLEKLRSLKTDKEFGKQTITTTLKNKETGTITDLNDKWGFNVTARSNYSINETKSSLIASFDELTLLDKLKYIIVYYKNNSNPYYYPNDTKTGIPCMSREDLKKYVPDEDGDSSNKNELQALGIIPSDANAPKTDDVEVGAVELFYVGYLGNSQGAINALAKFMEIKSVALLTQITQQSYRIKALKLYLKMLEIGLQELNKSYNTTARKDKDKPESNEGISRKTYLALKYAAANQTRTLITINDEDYIVMQLDRSETTDNYHLSNNNAYILVKATTDGINEFLGLDYESVDSVFKSNDQQSFKSLSDSKIIDAYNKKIKFLGNPSFSDELSGYDYLYKKVDNGSYYTITTDGEKYRYYNDHMLIDEYVDSKAGRVYPKNIDSTNQRMISNSDLTGSSYYKYAFYQKQEHNTALEIESSNNNLLFAKFDSDENTIANGDKNAIAFLPKELETVKTNMDRLTDTKAGGLSWNCTNPDKNTDFDQNWPSIVEMWQNTCQTAIDNVGSQIESVNKTIKSLRSKVDTFDSSSSRFRDKFYSTIMTVLNKIS